MAEIARIETSMSAAAVQTVVDSLAERHVPIIEMVGDRPIVTDTKLSACRICLAHSCKVDMTVVGIALGVEY